jgi:hypothetical protein
MYTKLIAIAAAFGIVFALASTSFADHRRTATTHSGHLKSGKIKRSTTLNTSPAQAPEVRGGTIDGSGKPDESNAKIIYF